ncbi:hypothetical protein D3C72_1957890 [compost metagenome]
MESVVWKAKAPIGRPSATIVSMRDWPKAPRVCLFDRIACSPAMSFASDWMLFCAVSITARRSCSRRRFSCVALVCSLIEAPILCVMPSIRWLSVWFSSAWRLPNTSAIAAMRPCISVCAARSMAICS